MTSRTSELLTPKPQMFTFFIIDLLAALRWIFDRRRFSIGFFLGWCVAFVCNTVLILYGLQCVRLLQYCVHQIIGILAR